MSGPWLLFRQRLRRYAISLDRVGEVAPSEQLHPVPRVPPHVGGVVNLRGEPLPVVRAEALLGEDGATVDSPAQADARVRHLIVLRSERLRMAVAVEQVLRIERSLEGRPCGDDSNASAPAFVSWIHHPGGEVGLVDPDALLDHAEAQLTEQRFAEGRQESCPIAF